MWRKTICAFCSAFLLLYNSSMMIPRALADSSPPAVIGKHAIVMEADTGEVLFEKASSEKAYPASLTKVLTAILLDEKVQDNATVTTSLSASEQEGSNRYFLLNPGEQLSKRDALYAMMVISANDAAMAVAEHIAGSKEKFAQLMNEKSEQLGLKNSHFVTPNGLHDPAHYTTAYDVALLVREALKHPKVLKAMGTKETDIHTNMREVHIKNPSKIHDNPLVIAGKTGFTRAAGNNLVEVFEENGIRYIAVDMQSNQVDEYEDIQKMVAYAKNKMKLITVKEKGDVIGEQVIFGSPVPFALAEPIHIPQRTDAGPSYELRTRWTTPTEGVTKGQLGGYVDVYYKGKQLESVPLLAQASVSPSGTDFLKKDYPVLVGGGVLIFLFGCILLYYRKKSYQLS
ncbi:D-alanyl-D-alanine carboxypeptidase family protein [Aneurinibacillus migulanus]|nr:D-alanyl-D-alanine carboxypeptidase family protein [Aneurinibacillus migulanus]MED0894016.1 D-alanyl-D-alanine carboxypeptidase [Aneurinibacillus migulanus]MED1616781.1 D-alanyl-D-alanine carboxypeptidase [Aneurinibacillus migulanus]